MHLVRQLFIAAIAATSLLGNPQPVSSYLPLALGTTWNLGDGTTSLKLSVTDRSVVAGETRATIHFENPWMNYDMLVRRSAAGFLLEGVQFDSVRNGYPSPLMMFGDGVAGQKWSSPFMTSTLVSLDNTVTTPSRVYSNVARYDIAFGNSIQSWYLAHDVGFVQFGVGGPKLVKYEGVPSGGESTVAGVAVPCPRVGIEPNPPANGDFSPAGKNAAFGKAVSAGANFVYISPTWAQLEPSPGRYDFSSVEQQFARAKSAGMETVVTIKTIDTSSRTIPSDLQNKAWDDPTMIARWKTMAAKIATFSRRLKWLNLGNEVDVYLTAHPSELGSYYSFVDAGERAVAAVSPAISTGLVFAFDSYQLNDMTFRALSPLLHHVSFTYYAGNILAPGGVGQRDPADVPFDIALMVSAAKGKPLVMTEIGFSSSPSIGSSQTLQQAFYSNIFAALSVNGGKVSAASFSFMSDIPSSVANDFAGVYGGSQAWASWFQHLGLFDAQGSPKAGWTTFQTQAKAFALPTTCRTR